MQISGVSLVLPWPHRLCFLRVLMCASCCYKLSPFQAHWGRWHCTRFLRPACLFTVNVGSGSPPLSCGVFLPLLLLQASPLLIAGHAPPLLLAGVFVYSSRGRRVFLPLLWSFPPSATLTSFPAPGCWACAAAPAFSGPACLFIVLRRIPLPPFGAQGAPPSLLHVFILLIAYYSVSLFSPGGGWSVQGAMLIWPRLVCGSTAYCLAHLVLVFPSHLCTGDWQLPRALLVSPFNMKWRFSAPAGGVKESQFCLLSVVLPARCSPASLQDFTVGGSLSASSL
jgi:hypothetical protein